MLKKPIEIIVLEITKAESEQIQQAKDLGLPIPEPEGEEVYAYFYTIDCLLPYPENPELTIVISAGQEFITKAPIEAIIEAVSKASL